MRFIAVAGCGVVAGAACPVFASLTLLNAPPPLSHVGNLVANGSFETGAPTPDGAKYYWATGTTLGSFPFSVPNGWQSAGTASTYATWGNDGAGTPHTQFSDNLPDGRNAVYFGNAGMSIDQTPTFNADGTVSFPGSPTFTSQYGGPCRLWQSINTPASPAPAYRLSFFASAEAALFGAYSVPGIFGLKITNVLAGDPIQYLSVPVGTVPLGKSHVYEYQFVPLNPLAPVTVEFINWGHYNVGGNEVGSELVVDDVIVNTVPGPGTMAVAVAWVLGMGGRRVRGARRTVS